MRPAGDDGSRRQKGRPGPLAGARVIEIGGIGPGPFAGMMLADMGASVLRVARGSEWDRLPGLHRGRTVVGADLKTEVGQEAVARLVDGADVLIEGFRPGVAERLGLGPEKLLARNPSLVYGRMTGWGQHGPLAALPGHDINYLGLTGALHAIGPAGGDPLPPLNLVADFGGGGMLLAYGLVCALINVRAGGRGQVVDAAMIDGASLLMTMVRDFHHEGRWVDRRGENFLDGAAPFYRTYRCSDDKHVAVGCVEQPFFADFLEVMGLQDDDLFRDQHDQSRWPMQGEVLARIFAGDTRDAWVARAQKTNACVSPVLSMAEAPDHPHNQVRGGFVTSDGHVQPAPAPRFSDTATELPPRAQTSRDAVLAALGEFGLDHAEVERLLSERSLVVPG